MRVFGFLYNPIRVQYICLHNVAPGPEQAIKTDLCESHARMRRGDPAHVDGAGQVDLLSGRLFLRNAQYMRLMDDPLRPDHGTPLVSHKNKAEVLL
jgi:hypothetical protein